jgi:fructokinase
MRVGIDLGGTKIEGLALDRRGHTLSKRRVDTPRGDYQGTVEAVAALVEDFERQHDRAATVGVGLPGAVSPATGLIKNANSTWLIGRSFQADLALRLGREVRCQNDANCFVLSEAADGAAAGAHVVFGVIIGTGTGGGIAVGGQVLAGANAIAGEWGHNPLPWPDPADGDWPGPPCYCGRRGCIETFLSGPGLAADFEAAGGPRVTALELAARAASGDGAADRCLTRYEGRLARALASVINVLDPDVIVLGGGLSNIDRLYARVPHLWAPFVFSDRIDTRLVKAAHGDSSGVRGAAWLWPADV